MTALPVTAPEHDPGTTPRGWAGWPLQCGDSREKNMQWIAEHRDTITTLTSIGTLLV